MRKLKRSVIKEEFVAITGNYKLALVLNQLLYWTERVGRKRYNKFIKEESTRVIGEAENLEGGWVYKNAEELSEELMINVSGVTVRNYLKELIDLGYILERKNPNNDWDKTKQYRVLLLEVIRDLEKEGYTLEGYSYSLESLKSQKLKNLGSKENNLGSKQNNLGAITETTTETTSTDITISSKDYTPAAKNEQENTDEIPYGKIVFYLNEKADREFKHTTKKTRRKIRARYDEGFGFSDFLTVIDKKVADWINDSDMSKYLRPETLFGTKFESYVNEPWPDDYDDDPEGFDQLKEIWGELEEEEEFING